MQSPWNERFKWILVLGLAAPLLWKTNLKLVHRDDQIVRLNQDLELATDRRALAEGRIDNLLERETCMGVRSLMLEKDLKEAQERIRLLERTLDAEVVKAREE